MSYSVHLYRTEVKEKHAQQANDLSFFEKTENLIPFTQEQKDKLHKRLGLYGYKFVSQIIDCSEYNHPDSGIIILLTDLGLYFKTSGDTFDMLLMASEFTDTNEFAKYDPQLGKWEEIE